MTATASSTLNNTPYEIAIVDVTTGVRLGFCDTDHTPCADNYTAYVAQVGWTATAQTYRAEITLNGSAVVTGNTVTISPEPWAVTLTSSTEQLTTGQQATLTATANQPITNTPYFIAIYDTTTGDRVGYCDGDHTPCNVTATIETAIVDWTDDPEVYVADVSPQGVSPTSAGVVATSDPVTISPLGGWSITLTASTASLTGGQQATLTAVSSQTIDGTPSYFIAIYDTTTGDRVGYCDGDHTPCTVDDTTATTSVGWSDAPQTYVADVSPHGDPPTASDVVAISDPVIISPAAWSVTLTTTAAAVGSGQTAVLTATANQTIDDTPYFIAIYDTTTGDRVGYCDGDHTPCTTVHDIATIADVGWSATPQTYVADVSPNGAPPTSHTVVAVSNPITISPTPWTVRLYVHPQGVGKATLTAVADQDVDFTPYWIVIYRTNGETTAAVCGSGSICTAQVEGSSQPYVAEVKATPAQFSAPFVARSGVVWAPSDGPSGGCGCPDGDPVYPSTGQMLLTQADETIGGRGPQLDLDRTYDSFDSELPSPFGYGWTSNFGLTLSVDPVATGSSLDTASIVDLGETNGGIVPFTRNADGTYTAPEPILGTLAQGADGSFTYIQQAQTIYTFDDAGTLVEMSDLNGNTLTLHHTNGELATITDSNGRAIRLAYNDSGEVTQLTDPAGRVTTYTYDGDGNLTSVTDPSGATNEYTYDSDHKLLTHTDPDGNVATNTYDDAGRVIGQTDRAGRRYAFGYNGDNTVTVTDPDGNQSLETYSNNELIADTVGVGTSNPETTTYTYNPGALQVSTVTDPGGHVWSATYDSQGNQTSVTDPDGEVTQATYNSLDEPLTVTDPMGVATTFTYDSNGNLISESQPVDGQRTATTTYSYADSANPGMPTTITDPRGSQTHIGYDSDGDVTSVTDPDGDETTYSYSCASGCANGLGWLYSSVSPRGNAPDGDPAAYTTVYTRDQDGRVVSQTSALGNATSYRYDANGNLTSSTDPRGQTTTYGYDGDGEQISVGRPDGTTTSTTYNGDGQVTGQTNGLGRTTTYSYNALGELTASTTPPTATNPNGITTSYGYNTAGWLSTLAQPGTAGSLTTSYGYDSTGRLTSVAYSDNTPAVVYRYDADGRRTAMTDGSGTSTYSYNLAGWLTSTTNGAGKSGSYGYDLDGDPTTITYPNGKNVTRSYDPAGRLVSVADWEGDTTSFAYDPDGDLIDTDYPNGVVEADTYRADDSMSGLTDTGGGSTLADYAYTRDPNNDLTGVTAGGTTAPPAESYGYNALDQLAQYTTNTPGVSSGAYSYDADGNLTSTPDGTTLSYDPADELTQTASSAGGTAYTYDARGDRTGYTPAVGAPTSYSYNAANELTRIHPQCQHRNLRL
ncbi:MAG TPA: DUF6531 domain-containing protein [Mycobacteriales bacterium]|nr:DUF6531 domain-containing protein [Mycobacteriales bacterium]